MTNIHPLLDAHVFISYSRSDGAFVTRLTTDLQEAGIQVWIDQQGLKPGTRNWEDALRQAISTSKAVLLIASPASRRSNYVQDELAIAEMYGRRIYPVWASGDQWIDCIPLGMGKVQFIDARDNAYNASVPQIIQALGGELVSVSESHPPPSLEFQSRNPYKGLRPFREDDQDDFFGRDALINDLVSSLLNILQSGQPRLLPIIGPSGSGKSSVVMAGLLPRLHQNTIGGSQNWIYLPPLVPGTDPLENLALALRSALPDSSIRAIADDLTAPSARGLHLLARQIAGQKQTQVILFIDQFEELFTQTTDETRRSQLIHLLVSAITEPNGPLIGILTLRADFYDRPMFYPELGKLLETNGKSVLPMSLADLYDVVQKPASLPDVQMTFDEGLVGELVFEVRDQIGGLPLLQFTLDQLFERRDGLRLTNTAYEAIGGLRGALAKHAEATYDSLPSDDHRRLTRALFLRLVEPGSTDQDTTRRRITLSELQLSDTASSENIQQVAATFVNARLLIADRDTLEVAHEALISSWSRLRDWIEDQRESLRIHRRLMTAAQEWNESGNDFGYLASAERLTQFENWANETVLVLNVQERAFLEASLAEREAQRRREETRKEHEAELQRRLATRLRFSIGLIFFLIVAIGLTAFAFSQRSQTQQALVTAEYLQNLSEAQRLLLAAEATNLANAQTELQGVNAELQDVNVRIATLAARPEIEDSLKSLMAAIDAQQALSDGDVSKAVALAIEANSVPSPPPPAQNILAELAYRPVISTFVLTDTTPTPVPEVSDERPPLAVRPVKVLALNRDGRIALLDDGTLMATESGRRFQALGGWSTGIGFLPTPTPVDAPMTSYPLAAAFSPDGRTVATGFPNGALILWHVYSGTEIRRFTLSGAAITSLAFSPDGNKLVSGAANGLIVVWSLVDNSPAFRRAEPQNGVTSVALHPDGQRLYAGLQTGQVITQPLDTSPSVELIPASGKTVTAMGVSPDGQTIIAGLADGSFSVTYRGLTTGQTVSDSPLISMAFNRDNLTVVLGRQDGSVTLWDLTSNQAIYTYAPSVEGSYSVAVQADTQDGARSFTAILVGHDMQLVRYANPVEVRRFRDDETTGPVNQRGGTVPGRAGVTTLIYNLDGSSAFSGHDDGSIFQWDVQTGALIRRLQGHSSYVATLSVSPDGKRVLSGGGDGSVILWNLETGQVTPVFDYLDPIKRTEKIQFTPDGQAALMLFTDESNQAELYLWNGLTGQFVRRFDQRAWGTFDFTLFADADTRNLIVISGYVDGNLIAWDMKTGREIHRLVGHTAPVTTIGLLADRRTIYSNAYDRLVFWSPESGQPLRQLNGLSFPIAVSPDGLLLLVADPTSTIITLWDTLAGETIRQFPSNGSRITDITFSPDGRTALSGSSDGTLTLWRIQTTDELIGWVRQRYPSAATPTTSPPVQAAGTMVVNQTQIAYLQAISNTDAMPSEHPLDTATAAAVKAATRLANIQLTQTQAAQNGQWPVTFTPAPTQAATPTSSAAPASTASTPTPTAIVMTLPATPTWDATMVALATLQQEGVTQTAVFLLTPPTQASPSSQDIALTATTLALLLQPSSGVSPTPLPVTLTASPTVRPTSTATPDPGQEARLGPNRGVILRGGGQRWTYQGEAGQNLTINARADSPANTGTDALDVTLIIRSPDGSTLAAADDILPGIETDAYIENLILPEAGVYEIEVRSYDNAGSGGYTLIIEAAPPSG